MESKTDPQTHLTPKDKSEKKVIFGCLTILILFFLIIAFGIGEKRSYKSNDHEITIKDVFCIIGPPGLDPEITKLCAKSLVFIDSRPTMFISTNVTDIEISHDKKVIALLEDYVNRVDMSVTINNKSKIYRKVEHFRMKKDGSVLYSILAEDRTWRQIKNFNELSQSDPDFEIGTIYDEVYE